MTLADIYASQGYARRALRIYREVQKRQPGNAALAAKSEALERGEAAIKPAVQPAPGAPAPRAKRPEPARPRSQEPARTTAPPSNAPPGNHPIDQTRSYEHFKRWLKSSR